MEVTRVDVTAGGVRRPRLPWTPAVHAALARLRAAGLDEVPAPVALDDDTEVVSFLPGEAGAACWPHQATEEGLSSVARLLRRVHDASAGWSWPENAEWAQPVRRPAEVLCHGDPGPWNMVWVDGRAAGLFDWDFCYPGPRRDDVAYALQWLAPFRPDEEAIRWHAFSDPPDRAGRIRSFCAAYGIDPVGMVDAVLEAQHRTRDLVRELATAGVEPQASWVAAGHLDELEARLRWTESHQHLFA